MADGKKKESHVKPRCTPEVVFQSATAEGTDQRQNIQAPSPTPIETMQYLAITSCGVPAEEITRDKHLGTSNSGTSGTSSSAQ